jgi:hypothetical protein
LQPEPEEHRAPFNLGTVPGDPDKVTVWLGASGETDLTRREAEELAALLLRAVQELGG